MKRNNLAAYFPLLNITTPIHQIIHKDRFALSWNSEFVQIAKLNYVGFSALAKVPEPVTCNYIALELVYAADVCVCVYVHFLSLCQRGSFILINCARIASVHMKRVAPVFDLLLAGGRKF